MDTDRLRLYVAIQVPEDVKTELQRAQHELQKAAVESVIRWTNPGQMHMTLRFLGYVQTGDVEALARALLQVGVRFAPVHLRAESVGFFPHARAPRVLWAGLQDLSGQLPELQHEVQQATAAFTAEPAEEKFVGHLTLGRVKFLKRTEGQNLANAASRLARTFGEWTADSVELIRSELSSSGASYSTLAQIRLAGQRGCAQ